MTFERNDGIWISDISNISARVCRLESLAQQKKNIATESFHIILIEI